MPQAPSITFLWVASRISKGGTIAPPGKASILSCPPVSLSTRSAKNLKASCVVDDGGTADCIFRTRGCSANANAVENAATSAAPVSEWIFIGCLPPLTECRRAIEVPPEEQAYRGEVPSARATPFPRHLHKLT